MGRKKDSKPRRAYENIGSKANEPKNGVYFSRDWRDFYCFAPNLTPPPNIPIPVLSGSTKERGQLGVLRYPRPDFKRILSIPPFPDGPRVCLGCPLHSLHNERRHQRRLRSNLCRPPSVPFFPPGDFNLLCHDLLRLECRHLPLFFTLQGSGSFYSSNL